MKEIQTASERIGLLVHRYRGASNRRVQAPCKR
jgi:hypothetical protein